MKRLYKYNFNEYYIYLEIDIISHIYRHLPSNDLYKILTIKNDLLNSHKLTDEYNQNEVMLDKSGSIAFGSFAVGYTDVTQSEIKQNAESEDSRHFGITFG